MNECFFTTKKINSKGLKNNLFQDTNQKQYNDKKMLFQLCLLNQSQIKALKHERLEKKPTQFCFQANWSSKPDFE